LLPFHPELSEAGIKLLKNFVQLTAAREILVALLAT
jgi:hypothetical protein